jgi:hypothetical protein
VPLLIFFICVRTLGGEDGVGGGGEYNFFFVVAWMSLIFLIVYSISVTEFVFYNNPLSLFWSGWGCAEVGDVIYFFFFFTPVKTVTCHKRKPLS